jgi:AcrR family transcriptional regulator
LITAAVSESRAARRQASRELKSRRVVEAALVLFAERGYYETSVDDVVTRARTSKTTFYEVFASKEDCLRELLRHEGGALIHAVVQEASTGSSPRERIRRGVGAFVHACARQRPLSRVLLIESVGVSPGVEEVRHGLHGRFAGLVEEEARRAQASDPFYATVDPVVYGRALVGAVNEATGHFLSQPKADAAALTEGLCQIFAPAE